MEQPGKEEKEFRRNNASCYYEELSNNLVDDLVTQEELALNLTPNLIVGIIFSHARFSDYLLENFCFTGQVFTFKESRLSKKTV